MRFSTQIAGVGAAGLIAAAGLAVTPGCGSSRQAVAPVNTGLAHLAEGSDPEPASAPTPDPDALTPAQAELFRMAEESAANLQSIFDQMGSGEGQAPTPTASAESAPVPRAEDGQQLQPELIPAEMATAEAAARTPQPSPFEDPAFDESAAIAIAIADASASAVDEPETPPPETLPPLRDRIRDHTIILVDLLRQQSITDEAPFRAYLGLAAMEVLWPGALQKVISPESSSAEGGLPSDQLAAIEAMREFATGAAALPQQPGSPIDALTELAERLVASRPMRIQHAGLCSRVSGFGQYMPLASTRFLHGRTQPVIIYTELASFAHRLATSTEATRVAGTSAADSERPFWSVELSQEVQVFNDADGLLVWSRPEQSVLETSRNRRRDFFLVNEIVLPRTLSVGRYQMKVIMRDKTSGAVDEAIIPFEVVADPALARGMSE